MNSITIQQIVLLLFLILLLSVGYFQNIKKKAHEIEFEAINSISSKSGTNSMNSFEIVAIRDDSGLIPYRNILVSFDCALLRNQRNGKW